MKYKYYNTKEVNEYNDYVKKKGDKNDTYSLISCIYDSKKDGEDQLLGDCDMDIKFCNLLISDSNLGDKINAIVSKINTMNVDKAEIILRRRIYMLGHHKIHIPHEPIYCKIKIK